MCPMPCECEIFIGEDRVSVLNPGVHSLGCTGQIKRSAQFSVIKAGVRAEKRYAKPRL